MGNVDTALLLTAVVTGAAIMLAAGLLWAVAQGVYRLAQWLRQVTGE